MSHVPLQGSAAATMSSGGQQMFNLRWNNFQSSISSALHEQLLDEELVDVTLSAEGRTVGAHRVVLSACSPYFKQLFKVGPATPTLRC